MKILVVGGAGYIGGVTVDLLLAADHTVRVYDCLLYEESYRKPIDFVFGDVRDCDRLSKHLDWADAVVWLAALVGDGACAINPPLTAEINQEPVRWLADHFSGRIVFMSTCSVYGAQDGVLDEAAPANPLSVYAATKLAAERYLKDKNAIIFRLGTIFGVGDLFSRIRLDLVVNILTVRAFQQGKIGVFGGEQFRPLLHVHDVAQAIVASVATSHAGIFNLHKQNVRIVDLAYQIRNHFPDVEIDVTPIQFQDARNYRVSSEKAQSVLGFRPTFSIDVGIEQIKDLLTSHRLKNVENPRYANQAFLTLPGNLLVHWDAA